jgi:27-O-demethylrifamycin SV methyltransferase
VILPPGEQTAAHDNHAPAAHYDRITEAWGLLLGEELHYGLFVSGDEELATATGELTTRMIDAARFSPGQQVLDVGCGTGAQACRLASEHSVEVLGITTSEVGVAAATERARAAGLSGARFEVRDGTDNLLPAGSFDRVWVLESSHLMPDRPGLLSDCARVLRPGGRLVLCDIIRRREIPFRELRDRRREFAVLRAAFGAARMDQLSDYETHAQAAGLTDIECVDITTATLPTFDRWQDNLDRHRDQVLGILGAQSVTEFEESLQILRRFWQDGTLGYGMMSAARPDAVVPTP